MHMCVDVEREDDCLVLKIALGQSRNDVLSNLASRHRCAFATPNEAASLSTQIAIKIFRTRMLLKNSYPS